MNQVRYHTRMPAAQLASEVHGQLLCQRRVSLLLEAAIELPEVLPARPHGRENSGTAALCICCCLLLALLHRMLLEAVQEGCMEQLDLIHRHPYH